VEDKRSGVGTVTFRKGQWKGNFKENQPHGEGIFTSSKGNETKGVWKHGEWVEPNI
jgi:hypothetical protein